MPYCTRAPTDFEKTTCSNAGGTLTSREMYGQQFSYCVFGDGTSCQVEDIASGWCSRRTPKPTEAPFFDRRRDERPAESPFGQIPQQNPRRNELAGIIPSLFGKAGSDVAGASTGTGLGYSEVAGNPDPTRFFDDQTGIANTGATAALAAGLAAAANENSYDTGAPPVPQPVPMITPETQSQPPSTPSPTSAALMSLLAQTTPAPAASESFVRIGNPLVWLVLGLIIAVVFFIYKKYGSKGGSSRPSAPASVVV